MDCQVNRTTTFDVAPGAEVFADLPQSGVLRFARQGAAMTGKLEITHEAGAMALHFADGASLHLKDF